jgi:hypothetical protein
MKLVASLVQDEVLRRIFAPKREEITERWKKLHNEEFRNLQFHVILGKGKD